MCTANLNVYSMKMHRRGMWKVVPVPAGPKNFEEAVNEAERGWVQNSAARITFSARLRSASVFRWCVRNFKRVLGDEAACARFWKRKGLPTVIAGRRRPRTPSDFFIRSSKTNPCGMVGWKRATRHPSRNSTGAVSRRLVACCRARAVYFAGTNSARSTPPTASGRTRLTPTSGPRNTPGARRQAVPIHHATDDQALAAFMKLARIEGIIPRWDSHAFAECMVRARSGQGRDHHRELSGRGDKDVAQVAAKGQVGPMPK